MPATLWNELRERTGAPFLLSHLRDL